MWWAQYIGIPFRDGGRGPDAYDCWGLLRRIYADQLGVDLPCYGEISAKDLARIAREMEAGKDRDGWQECGPEPLAVVLMRSGRGGRRVVHVGAMVDPFKMIHVEDAAATAIVPINHFSVAGRICGFRRLAQ
ncbi:C40 family peptidase [Pseudogemmobacter faecipullorum]|uniref:C40 family peptidase n=1 Tax=Pseudogemmobacter faecipullorum TaxID=2755041 RepID=A0ABS8CPM9_9RHOB|nr:NlpC/P60 family protein [Pseudogemmobacter faecipullorum]MCB5411323.1 C40 family peptidase [Pseudogemmobacter faecipullorum]